MAEKKEEIKIKLSTAVIIILILLVALGVMYDFGFIKNKNENIENETLTNATENIEVNNALTNDVEEEKTENTLNNNKTNNENSGKEGNEKVSKEEVKSRDYSEISSKLKGKEVFYVTDVVDNSDFDNTYILKGVIYDETTITKSELNKYLKEKKVEVDGQKYEIKKNEDGYYSLIDSKYDSERYWIKKKNNNTYTLESTTEFPTVYKLTNKYKQITVSGNLKCEYGETQEKTTVKKYFKNFEDRDPIDSTNPDGVFTFNFDKNGNCTKIVECVTGH